MVLILRAMPGQNRVMAGGELEAAAAAAWAEALGCDLRLLGEPGAQMVPGGAGLRGRNAVYMAEVRAAVLVYCPGRLRPRAAAVLASTPPGHLFTPGACAQIADVGEARILGPSWHGFTDAGHFTPAVPGAGRRLDRGDPLLAGLREACGETEWAEGGFADPDGVLYGIEQDGRLAAAGNLTVFRGYPADVGLLTHPAARGRGLATKVAVQMIADALPAAGIIRYRALAANSPSLAIARSLGFAGYGQNLIARLPP
jgi:Acetyltransferase (GNAT) family